MLTILWEKAKIRYQMTSFLMSQIMDSEIHIYILDFVTSLLKHSHESYNV